MELSFAHAASRLRCRAKASISICVRAVAISLATAVYAASPAHAQPGSSSIAPNAEQILNVVQGRYGQFATFDADVVQRVWSKSVNQRSTARRRVHFDTSTTPVWTLIGQTPAPRAAWAFLFAFLRNQGAGVTVQVRVDTGFPMVGPRTWITFSPNTVAKSSTRIALRVEPESGRLLEASIGDPSGDRETIDFQNERLTY